MTCLKFFAGVLYTERKKPAKLSSRGLNHTNHCLTCAQYGFVNYTSRFVVPANCKLMDIRQMYSSWHRHVQLSMCGKFDFRSYRIAILNYWPRALRIVILKQSQTRIWVSLKFGTGELPSPGSHGIRWRTSHFPLSLHIEIRRNRTLLFIETTTHRDPLAWLILG